MSYLVLGITMVWVAGVVPVDEDAAITNDESGRFVLAQRVAIDEPDLNVVAYDSGDADVYDMRAIEVYVTAALKAFPAQDYPGIRPVADAYRTARDKPTLKNGKAVEEAFGKFAEGLSDADGERMQTAMMAAIEAGMMKAQVDLVVHVAAGLKEAFSAEDYPAVGDYFRAAAALSASPDEEKFERAEAALAKFRAGLSGGAEAKVAKIEKEAQLRLNADYADATNQMMIGAWVSEMPNVHAYQVGDKGAFVSATAYGQLKGEMSYEEVQKIIGSEGNRSVSSRSDVDGVISTSAAYMWSWDLRQGIVARIHAFFMNDQLRVKAYDEIAD